MAIFNSKLLNYQRVYQNDPKLRAKPWPRSRSWTVGSLGKKAEISATSQTKSTRLAQSASQRCHRPCFPRCKRLGEWPTPLTKPWHLCNMSSTEANLNSKWLRNFPQICLGSLMGLPTLTRISHGLVEMSAFSLDEQWQWVFLVKLSVLAEGKSMKNPTFPRENPIV